MSTTRRPTWLLVRTRHYLALVLVLANQGIAALGRLFSWPDLIAVCNVVAIPLAAWMLYAIWTDDPRRLYSPRCAKCDTQPEGADQ